MQKKKSYANTYRMSIKRLNSSRNENGKSEKKIKIIYFSFPGGKFGFWEIPYRIQRDAYWENKDGMKKKN